MDIATDFETHVWKYRLTLVAPSVILLLTFSEPFLCIAGFLIVAWAALFSKTESNKKIARIALLGYIFSILLVILFLLIVLPGSGLTLAPVSEWF